MSRSSVGTSVCVCVYVGYNKFTALRWGIHAVQTLFNYYFILIPFTSGFYFSFFHPVDLGRMLA